jgi:hypothetical protein
LVFARHAGLDPASRAFRAQTALDPGFRRDDESIAHRQLLILRRLSTGIWFYYKDDVNTIKLFVKMSPLAGEGKEVKTSVMSVSAFTG